MNPHPLKVRIGLLRRHSVQLSLRSGVNNFVRERGLPTALYRRKCERDDNVMWMKMKLLAAKN